MRTRSADLRFQSTPARCRRLRSSLFSCHLYNFNPLQREAGDEIKNFFTAINLFQSTPARSRRQGEEIALTKIQQFQSTPARSRRPACSAGLVASGRISIHSSAKPETHRLRPQGSQWNISIHSSAKPETGKSGGETMNLIISIHSSAKPETLERSIFLYNREFQSTPARSRRPMFAWSCFVAVQFQSTPARSRRRQLLPISIYILHISLYKSTNVLYSPPHSSTNPPITMRFFQCESPKKLMSTYVSHHQSTISL